MLVLIAMYLMCCLGFPFIVQVNGTRALWVTIGCLSLPAIAVLLLSRYHSWWLWRCYDGVASGDVHLDCDGGLGDAMVAFAGQLGAMVLVGLLLLGALCQGFISSREQDV